MSKHPDICSTGAINAAEYEQPISGEGTKDNPNRNRTGLLKPLAISRLGRCAVRKLDRPQTPQSPSAPKQLAPSQSGAGFIRSEGQRIS